MAELSSITINVKFDKAIIETFKEMEKRVNKLEKELRLIKYSKVK